MRFIMSLGMELLGYRNLCLVLVNIVKQFSKVVGVIYILTKLRVPNLYRHKHFFIFLKSSYSGRRGVIFYCFPFKNFSDN